MIYCVEDDTCIRELMLYTLTSTGMEAVGFETGEAFFEAVHKSMPDLAILDIMLPGDDGITILKKLRNTASTADLPVIMATAKGSEYDRIHGLDLGADDYLVKPFGMMEMVSRVRAVLRRCNKSASNLLRLGDITINNAEHKVMLGNEVIVLTLKEYDLLYLLMTNLELVFTRDHLLQRVWGIDFKGETRTVDVHIGTLRAKLGSCGALIETVRGIGYRMVKSL